MVSFLASKSSSREGIACTDMHAAKMETSTKVTDVQTNGSLHFLGKTSITLQKLCKHWGYNDRHWFSCGFSLQYIWVLDCIRGLITCILIYIELNSKFRSVFQTVAGRFDSPPFPRFLLQALYPKRMGTCASFIISFTPKICLSMIL